MSKKTVLVSILLIAIVVTTLTVVFYNNSNNSYDQKLEPVIIKVSGLIAYTESSKILSVVQYYNEDEELHYYEVEFEYEYYPINSEELTYKKKEALIIIDHEIRGSSGDFYFLPELELDKNKDALNQYNTTILAYNPIASYTGEELSNIVNAILRNNGYNQ